MSAPTLPPAPAASNAGPLLPRPRRWGTSGRRDPVAIHLAPELGMRPQAVEKLLRSCGPSALNLRVAAIVRAFRALGDTERLGRFWAPMQAAYDQREAPPLCDAVLRLAQEAVAAELVADTDFLLDRSDVHLDRDIRASERLILRETAKRDAMVAEQSRRRHAQ